MKLPHSIVRWIEWRRAGGRPRLIGDEDIEVIVAAARTRPKKPVRPFAIGDDQLRGVTRKHKGAGHTLAALKTGPGRPARRVPAVHHHGQPAGEQGPGPAAPGLPALA